MGKKIIFLDRDGVINKEIGGYVTNWKDFKFIRGSMKGIKILTDHGFDVNIISNQAGIAKGLMKKRDLDHITNNMLKTLKNYGTDISEVHYCPHQTSDECDCRKPKIGLFKNAAKKRKINFKKTYFIGDNERDIMAGNAAGCKTILVLSGQIKKKDLRGLEVKPDFITRNLLTAVRDIVLKYHYVYR